MSTLLDVIESLHRTVVFDSKDYSISKRDAWLYGIVCGWDGPSMTSLAKKFGWSDEDVERLRSLRRVWTNTESRQRRVKALQEKMEAESQEIEG